METMLNFAVYGNITDTLGKHVIQHGRKTNDTKPQFHIERIILNEISFIPFLSFSMGLACGGVQCA